MQAPRCKGAGNVLLPLAMRQVDLARRVSYAPKASEHHGDCERPCHRLRKKGGLIVPPRAAPSPVKWDWDDGIDPAGPRMRASCHHRPERGTELAAPVVLESLNRIRHRTTILEDGAWLGCALDEGRTCGAKDLGAFGRFVAPRTSARRKKDEQAV